MGMILPSFVGPTFNSKLPPKLLDNNQVSEIKLFPTIVYKISPSAKQIKFCQNIKTNPMKVLPTQKTDALICIKLIQRSFTPSTCLALLQSALLYFKWKLEFFQCN